ncbi:MAG: (d)CMP kinase [Halorhodospira halophila]|uniref:(d)CMP kinase n=1 Tax=Halorhodospira TaxID=85108 RepID=UPI001911EE9C|nr:MULTISPECIES: (d)CMP kinase [Halorhodospira]MBK5936774.1 cytidylate kinase [Halorhodospira halophila]MBK5942885.1 cytidylate kinase [Halorhodospira halophila]MCC3750475.1 (d)CMP kinase [Halorhodospira halophila]MCG5528747.1 (d)CMP kinase [Halorhodospira halophila]MCG5534106.1 (d)CMP kinase [Halorhodospira sp. 9621]
MTQTNPPPVLAIDGPSGAGKGTVAKAVVLALGWHFLDSGALYRLTGLYCQRQGVAADDAPRAAELAAVLPAEFRVADGAERILLDGDDVSAELRTETTGALASQVAALQAVRDALLQRQRDFRRPPGLVADGRDMGTVVFPDAPVKVFLTASAEERARRRYNQLKEQGADVSLASLSEEIAERDRRDASRTTAPLKPAPDAEYLDTTGLAIETVIERVLAQVRGRLG